MPQLNRASTLSQKSKRLILCNNNHTTNALQAPPYKELPKKLRKTSQGGRHIWQLGQPLSVGDLVDARDREKSWFESYVTEVRPSAPSTSPPRGGNREREKEKYDVKVHYMGWGSKWDDWVSEWDLGARIAPLNSRSKNWRADLFEGGLIEIKCNDDMVNQKWMWGKIIALNYSEGWVDVSYTFTNEPTVVKRADLFGETLCMVGMHTKDKSKLAAASIVKPERKVEELLRSRRSSKNLPVPLEDFTFCDLEDSVSADVDVHVDVDVEVEVGGLASVRAGGMLEQFTRECEYGASAGLDNATYRSSLLPYQLSTLRSLSVPTLHKNSIRHLTTVSAADCIGSIAFNCIMREVLEIVIDKLYLEESLEDSNPMKATEHPPFSTTSTQSGDLFVAATEVLRCIAASTSRRVIVPYFCRALTVQCGLRAKLITHNELVSCPTLLRIDVSVIPLATLLDRLDRLGDRYCSMLLRCFGGFQDSDRDNSSAVMDCRSSISSSSSSSSSNGSSNTEFTRCLPIHQLQHAARRIKATVSKCAIAPLAHSVFRSACPDEMVPIPSLGPVTCLAHALTASLLEGSRFSSSSTAVRRLLGILVRSASDKDLDYLETLWTGAVTAWVVGTVHNCDAAFSDTTSTSSTSSMTDPSHPLHDTTKTLSSIPVRKHDYPSFCDPLETMDPLPSCKDIRKTGANVNTGISGSIQAKGDYYTVYGLLPRLISMLAKARSISKLEFSAPKQCARSADVAFCKAFKLISEESRCFLLRAIVHLIDNCLAGDAKALYDDMGGSDDSALFVPVSSLEDLQDFLQVTRHHIQKTLRSMCMCMCVYVYVSVFTNALLRTILLNTVYFVSFHSLIFLLLFLFLSYTLLINNCFLMSYYHLPYAYLIFLHYTRVASSPQIILTEPNMRYFEHFYRISLAKRLLRGAPGDVNGHVFGRKESSLLSEWGVVNALPPMSLTADMIADVEQAADRMSDFRHYLLVRIDNDDFIYPPSSALTLAVKPGVLNVHVLTASCWPKGILLPVSYAALKLPYPLSTMANEFENFYLSSSSNRVTYSRVPQPDQVPLGTGIDTRRVAVKGTKKLHWCHGLGSVTLSCRIQSKYSRPSSVMHTGNPTSSTHSSSSASSSSTGTYITIVLSTPQAVVLMAFQSSISFNSGILDCSHQAKIERNLFTLGTMTGLWEEELRAVIASLCDTSAPLLQLCFDSQNKEIFSLSEQLMTGNIKGMRDGDALIIKASALHPCPRSLTSPGDGLIRSWRDNMIDACIVRTLKGVERDRSGVFVDCKGRTLRAVLSSDTLEGLVKAALETKNRLVLLPSKEIRRRCSVLVDQGSIGAVEGQCVGTGTGTGTSILQPMGYSYMPDVPLHASSSLSKGEQLFADLCQLIAPTPTLTSIHTPIAVPPHSHSHSPSPSPSSPIPPPPLAFPIHSLAPAPAPQPYSQEELSSKRISKDQFCTGLLSWIANLPLESSSTSSNSDLLTSVNRWSHSPALSLGGKALPGSGSNSPVLLKDPSMKCSGAGEINDRCGEQKENQSMTHSRSSPLNYGYEASDSTHLVRHSLEDSVQNIQKKIILALTLSKERLEKWKYHHLLNFGLDTSQALLDSQGRHNHGHGDSYGGSGGVSNGDGGRSLLQQDDNQCGISPRTGDVFCIKRTMLENLPYATQQLVMKIFHSLQHTDEDFYDPENDNYAAQEYSTSPSTSAPMGNTCPSTVLGSDSTPYAYDLNSTKLPVDCTLTHSGKESLKFTGVMEGKSMERESTSDSIKLCDKDSNPHYSNITWTTFKQKTGFPPTEDLMTDFIKSQWDLPVDVCLGKVKSLMSSLHAVTHTHSYSSLQGREEGALIFLHGLSQVLPGSDSEHDGKYLNITDIFTFTRFEIYYIFRIIAHNNFIPLSITAYFVQLIRLLRILYFTRIITLPHMMINVRVPYGTDIAGRYPRENGPKNQLLQ